MDSVRPPTKGLILRVLFRERPCHAPLDSVYRPLGTISKSCRLTLALGCQGTYRRYRITFRL